MAQVRSQFTLIKIQGSGVNPILLWNLWLMPKVTQELNGSELGLLPKFVRSRRCVWCVLTVCTGDLGSKETSKERNRLIYISKNIVMAIRVASG